MATFYLPDENGWREDHGEFYYLRLQVEQVYNPSANTSTLTITPQAKKTGDAMTLRVMDNTYLQVNGTTLLARVSEGGTGSTDYRFVHTDTNWVSMSTVNGGAGSFSTTVAHDSGGAASVTFEIHGRFGNETVQRSFFDNQNASLTLSESASFTLTISAGTGSSITVTRGAETLTNGAVLRGGDTLTVSFAAAAGYSLLTHTLNGANFPSGGTHTVAGNVTVAATAALQSYTLTISAGTGSSITVTRGGTALANGAALVQGDVLTVSFTAARGYALRTHTLNGASFPSGGTHTVTGGVAVAATARLLGAVRLDTGSALRTYALRLDTGAAYVPVRLFVDDGQRLREV